MSDLSPAQERAVRLALALGQERLRANRAEATIARVRTLRDRWQTTGNPAAHELHQALTERE